MKTDMPNDRSRSIRSFYFLVLIAVGALFFSLFFLFFIIANTHWTPVFIPNLPWMEAPFWAAFESPMIVVILISMVTGAIITALLYKIWHKQNIQKQQILKSYISTLEKDLEKTQRLIASINQERSVNSGDTANERT